MAPTATKTTTRSRATKPTGGATRAPSKKSQQDEATRLKTEALETLTTAVVMLDRDLNITYLNRAAQEFMFDHEAAFGEASPQFSADQLVGESVDVLIPDLRHQRPLTDPASLPYRADLNVGDHIVALSASGHLDGEGEFLGCTIELSDITEAIDRDTQVEAVNRSLARVEFTLDGTILTANQNFFDAMGYTEDQIVGQHHRVLVDPAYAASPEYANFWDQLGRGQLDEGEYRRYKKSGDLIWLKASYNLAFDRDGNPTKVIKLASDITAEKQRLAEAKFKSEALGTVRTAIMMVDRDLCINYMNDAAYKLMKGAEHAFRTVWPTFNADTLIGECIDQFHTNPAHQRRLLDDPANLPFSADIEVAGLSFGLNVTAQINDDGEYVGSALEWEDLTKLLDVTAKIEAIDRTQAMIEFDMNGIVLGANQNFYDRMGYTEAEVVGKHHRIFVDPTEAASPAYNMFWESLGRGQYDEGEYRRFTKSGEEIWLQASYNPVVDRKGDPVKVVKVARDITSEVQSRQQIQSLVETSSSVMESVARGDLTRSVPGTYDGNLGLLQDAINASVENLSGLVTNIRESAVSMSSSAKEVATANQDLSRRTEAQASSLEETASSMEEMTATVQQNADNSRKASQLAVSAREQAQDGGTVVDQAVEAMQAISESSKKIADIIGVIDEIAFQTNLLALNAAVEAARAGDQGRGFAVVASEVRNLAQRSAGAAKEIKTLIQDSLEKVDDGSNLVNQSGTQLGEIVSSVKKVSDIIGEIAAASEEQSAGITQVNQAVTQMDQGTQQNAAMVEQASAASTSVQEQSHALLELTQQFQVSGMSSGNSPSGSVKRSTPPPAASPAPAVAEPVQQAAPVENYSSGDDDAWAEF